MKIIYNPNYDLRFSNYGIEIPIVDDRASKVFDELKILFPDLEYFSVDNIPKISKEDLLLVHTEEYVNELYKSEKSLERCFLNSYELIDLEGNYHRFNPSNSTKDFNHAFQIVLGQVGLSYEAMKTALQNKFTYFLGGGMHHAMTFAGRGFCLVSDIVIGIKKLQNEKLVKTVWVIDVDAHKGDGTAEISKRDPTIVTMSIHMKEGWPLNSGSVRDPWFIPSKVDIGIDEGDEDQYLIQLKAGLEELKNNYPQPDLAIVVNGADPYEYDELESASLLKLSKEDMLNRDLIVYKFLSDLNIPQAYLMAGGYGTRSWEIYLQFLEFVGKCSS